MLRIILCVFIPLFFNHNNLSSQILKLSGGINRTWMNEKPFDTPCLTYTGSLGYDYLLDRDYHDWFYLSSEIGYIKRSGKNAITGLYFTVAYLKGFSGVGSMMQADSSDKTFYNNSLLFTIGIGYRVKKKKINYWHYSSL